MSFLVSHIGTSAQVAADARHIAHQRVRYFEITGPMDREDAIAEVAKVEDWGADTCNFCRCEYQYPVKWRRYGHQPGQELCPDCSDD